MTYCDLCLSLFNVSLSASRTGHLFAVLPLSTDQPIGSLRSPARAFPRGRWVPGVALFPWCGLGCLLFAFPFHFLPSHFFSLQWSAELQQQHRTLSTSRARSTEYPYRADLSSTGPTRNENLPRAFPRPFRAQPAIARKEQRFLRVCLDF